MTRTGTCGLKIFVEWQFAVARGNTIFPTVNKSITLNTNTNLERSEGGDGVTGDCDGETS